VGVVDREKILDGSRVRVGDVALGLPSMGLHTNGYSLARKVLLEEAGFSLSDRPSELGGLSVGEALLAPHRSYLVPLRPLLEEDLVHAMAHITGGGFYDNIPRVLPDGVSVRVQEGTWPVPPLFELIARRGHVSREEMFHVFNMGVGMVLLVDPAREGEVVRRLEASGERVFPAGLAVGGDRKVAVEFARA
jgi:phosphoribosylformylglycinamidine cyclo-ligase